MWLVWFFLVILPICGYAYCAFAEIFKGIANTSMSDVKTILKDFCLPLIIPAGCLAVYFILKSS